MSGMSGDSTSTNTMSMAMVFTNNHSTPLFSSKWTPSTSGAYAGTCIFLVVLAVISRLLSAYRHTVEQKWHDRAVNRRYIVVAGETEADRERQTIGSGGEKSEEAVLTSRGMDERVKVVRTLKKGFTSTPWRFSTDLPRACIFTVQAGVGYLL